MTSPPETEIVCDMCPKSLVRKPGPGRRPKYCSPRCKDAASYAKSKVDGRYEARKAAAKRDRATPAKVLAEVDPVVLVRPYIRKKSAEPPVSYSGQWGNPGQLAAGLAHLAQLRAEGRFDQSGKDRKLKPPTERFWHWEIYDRDGWICQLCTKPVNQQAKYPDPYSPSLDHRIPLNQGGHHTRVNAQLAHLTCNIAKGDRC